MDGLLDISSIRPMTATKEWKNWKFFPNGTDLGHHNCYDKNTNRRKKWKKQQQLRKKWKQCIWYMESTMAYSIYIRCARSWERPRSCRFLKSRGSGSILPQKSYRNCALSEAQPKVFPSPNRADKMTLPFLWHLKKNAPLCPLFDNHLPTGWRSGNTGYLTRQTDVWYYKYMHPPTWLTYDNA